MEEMKGNLSSLVREILEVLVDYPDELQVSATETSEGAIMVEIRVNPDDAGKVIGRQGRVIKAIRILARACASQANLSAEVELID